MRIGTTRRAGLRAFAPASGLLRCVGALDGAPCAHATLVDLRAGAGMGVWGGSATGARGRQGIRAAAPGPRARPLRVDRKLMVKV